ncbi:MAG: multicopper oxidase domain-containing protein [Bacteroidetes bacterium]|nr:multicopper oxidase domain-containing protein [Bacteroidota bacterium]
MKRLITLVTAVVLLLNANAQYNTLKIPDTLSGTTFNLTLKDTFAQLKTGNQTVTGAINNNNFWGPTLIMNKGDVVHMNVQNKLNDSTTIHWHGMHLPAVMDGGPHQVIPINTIWQPYWTVKQQAATLWYHPHLHEMTQEHITKGIGGFIIIRDAEEAALPLPRTYGVDDIPLALTSRRYDASNAFVYTNCSYGDSMLVNGTPNPQVSLPKQFVRFRILNAEMQRAYNLGFSDGRTFYVIGNDGGLLNAPVAVTRMILAVGERVEILVDLTADAVGSSLDLKAYNSGFAIGFPGGEPNTTGQFGSYLNNKTFNLLHIKVVAATANAITIKPTTLINNTYWTAANATVNKTVAVTGGTPGSDFTLDNNAFSLTRIDKTVNLDAIEQWTITNNNVFGHTFHIHDIEFKIVARSSGTINTYESGWKDVLYLPRGESATFVAKFDDYADSIHPFMYHCHFSPHEDAGMMGQFVVKSTGSLPINLISFTAALNNKQVLLNWAVSNSLLTKSFSIERSTNAADWTTLGSVNTNNTANNETYTYIDASPNFGVNYYRLKFNDNDGKSYYSNIQTIEIGSNAFYFSVYPNPAQSKLYFNFNDPSYEVYYITITDKLGRTMYMLPKPQLQSGLDVSKLAKGIYYLQVTDNKTKKTVTQKFVKG